MKQKYQRFPPHKKTDRHDIAEILLEVALNNIKQTTIKIDFLL